MSAELGTSAERFAQVLQTSELEKYFLLNEVLAGVLGTSNLALLAGRGDNAKTTIYGCRNRACQLPVHPVVAALEQLALA